MARNIGRLGTQFSAVASVKTLLLLTAPTNQDIVVREVGVSFDGTSVTATPIDVQVIFETSSGTGGGSLSPTKVDERTPTSLQSTGLSNVTAEGLGNEILRWFIHPQTGLVWQATPYQNEIIVKGGDRVGIRIATTPASVDCNAYMIFEE